MPDLGPGFNKLSGPEQAAVLTVVDKLARQYPEAAGDVAVTSAFGSISVNVKAPPGREMEIQNALMGAVTDIMLDTGILIILLVSRRD